MNNDIDCTFLQNKKAQKPRYGVGKYFIIDGPLTRTVVITE
jgi:hypothetical protein